MTENLNTGHTTPQGQGTPPENSFWGASSLILFMIITGLLAQNLYDWFTAGDALFWMGVASAVILIVSYFVAFYGALNRIIHTPFFSISSLLIIAAATALGTFVSQNAPADVFIQRYGATGSKLLNVLQLGDVFHSWWYIGLYVLLLASLIRVSSFRGFTKENLGFHLAHLSPLIIIGGIWFDYFYGFKGIVKMEVGDTKDMVWVYDVNNKYIADSTQLPFKIRLDSFASQKYEPDFRIQIWKMDTAWHNQARSQEHNSPAPTPSILASLPLEEAKIHNIYGTDFYFRLTKAHPNFVFDYTYPEVTDTIEPVAPGIFIDMVTKEGDVPLLLRADIPGRDKLADVETIGAWLEYYYELPVEVTNDLKKAKSDNNRIIFSGKEEKIYFHIDGKLTSGPITPGEFYPFPKGDDPAYGFSVRFLCGNADYVNATPSSDGDEWLNPVAFVEIWKKGQQSQEVYLYSTTEERSGGHFLIPNTEFFLALESVKDMETKYWRSDLAVLDEGGNVVKKQVVKVNEIMLHKGYRFYQNDYDPDNPNYSGIGVSKEPGLYIIYFGFFLIVAGCFIMLYYRMKDKETEEVEF